MDAVPGRLERGAQERAGRTLAVGAGDVEHWRQVVVRIAKPGEQPRDAIEAEHVSAGPVREKPVELCLDGRISGGRVVRHAEIYAAAFCPAMR